MLIVFLGNCQVQVVAEIIRRFVGVYGGVTTEFLNTYQPVPDTAMMRLRAADVAVLQESLHPPAFDHGAIPARAAVHRVPSVNGSFLYPYQGLPHPLKPVARYGNAPYPGEYTDRYLSKLILAGVPAADALANYQSFDVAAAARVGRLYEIALEGQRRLDARTDYDCAGIIENFLREEQLFQSAFHYGGRIARHLAAELCDRLGLDTMYGQRIRTHLIDVPFVPRFVPVHPSVARYFEMQWVTETTLYPFMWEGSFTFDDYVLRYMEARWNPLLQEGVIDARRGDDGAREKLEAGLRDSPHSAVGAHEMSRLREAEGDLAAAVDFQKRAVANGGNVNSWVRLGVLLRKQGNVEAAAEAFAAGARDDPVSVSAWAHLRDCFIALGRFQEALPAAAKAAEFAMNREAAEAVLHAVSKRTLIG